MRPVLVRSIVVAAAAAVVVACGDPDSTPEVVVSDATLDGAAPVILGATSDVVLWSASPSPGMTLVAGSSLASLPAAGMQLATASGPVAQGGDEILFVADATISRVGLDGAAQRIANASPDALAGGAGTPAVAAWTSGADVSWGIDDVQMTATLTRVDRCDHARVTAQHVYVAADGTSGRRLLRIDQRTAVVTPVTASSTWAAMFPGGGMAGATYRGRVADADDDGALWLVEELPSGRGIVVHEPVEGEASILLEHLSGATGFFRSDDALYWQEGDALLSAPRAGGAASIVASLPGPASAFADGYVYFTHGAAIERLRVE